MRLTEEFLTEATFDNIDNLRNHYKRHVLKYKEPFDENDPKFPFMTMNEYRDRAENLSLEPAGTSEDRQSHVIGFYVKDNRKVKVKKRSNFFPDKRFCEVVVYVTDDDTNKDAIISYYLGRFNKIYSLKQNFTKQLDEGTLNDKMAAEGVIKSVEVIGDVTYREEGQGSLRFITEAEKAYDALSDTQKSLVDSEYTDELSQARKIYDDVDKAVKLIKEASDNIPGRVKDSPELYEKYKEQIINQFTKDFTDKEKECFDEFYKFCKDHKKEIL